MCTRCHVNIKAVSGHAPMFGDVPCGVCAECRNVKRSEWTFRLRVELESLVKRGWNVEFCTLTYNEDNVPRVPLYFAKDKNVKSTPMCFSRDHVKTFIKGLRNWLYRELKVCKDDKLRFMVCCEYGEETKRSHYHAIFATPPKVDTRQMFEKVHSLWSHGFVFPRYYEGGVDSHNYHHKPFVVESVGSACAYCAKYCAKDLSYFNNEIDLNNYYKAVTDWEGNEDKLSRYMPFHSQSQSLGSSFLAALDDKKKLEVLLNGYSFVGDDHLRTLPIYLKNKIVFNIYYVFDKDGKRLCRKQANDFFRRNYREIFKQKANIIEDKVKQWRTLRPDNLHENLVGYWDDFTSLLGRFSPYSRRIAEDYLAYGGVWSACCVDVDRPHFWLSRYLAHDNGEHVEDVLYYAQKDINNYGLVRYRPDVLDCYYLDDLNRFFALGNLFDNSRLANSNVIAIEEERKIQRIKEIYSHSV